jgi:gliding motility-associated-like protein
VQWDGFPDVDSTFLGNLTAGTYPFIVEDLNTGCSFSGADTIYNIDILLLTVEVLQHETQRGLNDGICLVSWQGGLPNYDLRYFLQSDSMQYTLDSTGAIRFEQMAPGSYTWVITDAEGCEIEITIEILEGDCLFQVLSTVGDLICHNDDSGSIHLEFLNTIGEVVVHWPDFPVYSSLGASFVTGIPSGVYLIIIEDGSGCDQSVQITVTEPEPIVLSCSATHESGVGLGDGQVILTFSGNRGWTTIQTTIPGFSDYNPAPGDTQWVVPDVPPGSYLITILDEWNCTTSCQIVVRPANCDMQISSISPVPPSCHGGLGSIAVTISDPAGNVSIVWSDIGLFNALQRDDLPAGEYAVIITDEIGCQRDTTFSITQPPILEASISDSISPACGRQDGQVWIQASGGTGQISASWSNGIEGFNISGLGPDRYTVTVSDANGCSQSLVVDLNEISGPSIVVVDLLHNTCHGDLDGSIVIEVQEGTGPFLFDWSNGIQVENQLSDLAAGDYTVVVTDSRDCTDTLSFLISEPDPISPGLEVQQPDCDEENGAILFTPTGGTPPYQIFDASGQVSDSFTNLGEGTFSFWIRDAASCEWRDNVNIIARNKPVCSAGEDQALRCDLREVTLVGSMAGSTMDQLMYCWINGITGDTINIQQEQLNVKEAGIFVFYVLDRVSGCFDTDTVIVADSIYEITFVDMDWTHPICPGEQSGTIRLLEIEGGTAPYTILLNQSPVDLFVDDLNAGIYVVNISDRYGCVWPGFAITLQDPSSPTIQLPEKIEPVKGRPISIIPIIQWSDPVAIVNWYAGNELLCSNCDSPILTRIFEDSTYLTLEIINEQGCVFTRSVWIYPMDDLSVFIPNSFTPNGDGINDRFFLFDASGISRILSFEVFDRWGSKVFQKRDLAPHDENQGWDGTFKGVALMPDHFIYTVEVLFTNGNKQVFYGGVQLIR